MKRITTLIKGMLPVAALFLGFAGFAGNGCDNNPQASVTELYLSIPNDGKISANTVLTLKTQITASSGTRSAQIVNNLDNRGKNNDARELFFKDGKVDVDIIIRGSEIAPLLSPFVETPVVKVKIASIISYITVDNISGVFQSNETGVGNNGIATRLVDIHLEGADTEETSNTGSSAAFSIELEPGNLQNYAHLIHQNSRITGSDVLLYPNPAVGGNFFIDVKAGLVQIKSIEVFNSLGSLVYSSNNPFISGGQLKMNLPEVPAGVYFARVLTSNGDVVKKFNITR
jgi:hypothetical protein